MKGPNAYAGQDLNTQTAGAYTDALGVAGNQVQAGQGMMDQGSDWLNDAAGGFGAAAGMMPTDITAGQLADTNLDPYMDPYQRNVIDTTMEELYRQEMMNRNNIGSQFQAAGAFGGDRQAIESAENRRNFNTQRGGILAQLNSANFKNAQEMAGRDIDRRFGADQANQGMRTGMYQFGTQGKAGLGRDAMGAGMDWYDPDRLSRLADQGFGFADTIAKNNLQSGMLQQQQIQSIIDAARLQWEQFQGRPMEGLGALTGSMRPLGGTTTTNNPGVLGILGGGLKALGGMTA
jgi:hypothetical protein